MNLHPLIPNNKLPKCLRVPLIIGNLEQISALKVLKKNIEDKLAGEANIESGKLKSFKVFIEYKGSQVLEVYAENCKQAKECALERVDISGYDDMEIRVNYVKETKGEARKP